MSGETAVNQVLTADLIRSAAVHQTRQRRLALITLDEMSMQMANLSSALMAVINGKHKAPERDKALRSLVANEIRRVVNGRMTVVDYSQRNASRQQIYLYVGTHWRELQAQYYYDFVRDSCLMMGLPQDYTDDQAFMNIIFERVAFILSRGRDNEWPTGEVWINLQNGTLELHPDGSTQFREHRPEDFFLYCLDYPYDPSAQCPLWHRFLDQVLPQPDAQQLLSEYVGYCFTRNLKLEKMAVFFGTGSNGKSVVLDVLEHIFGRQNISNVTLNALTQDLERRAMIEDRLANISHESGGTLDNAMMKQLVSGEPTEVRLLYRGPHTMYRYAKFFTSFNRLPRTEQTFGWFRRWLLFPFRVTIQESEQDPDLTHKLCQELSGILNWVLTGLQRLVTTRSFSPSPTCTEALNDYKRTSNSVLLFLATRCESSDDARTTLKQLYNAYSMFCLDEGAQNHYRKSQFREMVEEAGYASKMEHKQLVYKLKLIEDDEF